MAVIVMESRRANWWEAQRDEGARGARRELLPIGQGVITGGNEPQCRLRLNPLI
jgi:hypothetical protein